jgi:hypothetical protein
MSALLTLEQAKPAVREKTKAEVQKDIQRSNLALAEELFGVSAASDQQPVAQKSSVCGDERRLTFHCSSLLSQGHVLNAKFSDLSISSEADYLAFAKDVSSRLAPERRVIDWSLLHS